MSHHDNNPFNEEDVNKFKEPFDPRSLNPFGNLLVDKFREEKTKENPEAGATGNFPEGKITEDDKGEIVIKIAAIKGKVIVDFGKVPINWIGLTPDEALGLGRALFEKADMIKHGA